MNESTLNSLVKIFALITLFDKETDEIIALGYIRLFLKKNFSPQIVNLQIENFTSCTERYYSDSADAETYADIILSLCEKINKNLEQKQKLLILINIIQFIKQRGFVSSTARSDKSILLETIQQAALVFKFTQDEFWNLFGFMTDQLTLISNKSNILILNSNQSFKLPGVKYKHCPGLLGQVFFLTIETSNTFLFRYYGEQGLSLTGTVIYANFTYIFEKGSSIKGETIQPVYYNDIVSQFTDIPYQIEFRAHEIEYQFPNSQNGVRQFSFKAHTGQLIGIMGTSGSGKSTLLNLLNGSYPLNKGSIYINGHDLHDDKSRLDGIIGYVPQEDLLIEELTVFQNLYYNAKLCFGGLAASEILAKVNHELEELDLFEIKDLLTGGPLNKFISGGQRKRLNIALENIRKPYILFIDEPTSGLSSSDSEKLIELLKAQALSGKLLIINIHQPASEIFKQFDKILFLDKGGYPVYYGDPIDALTYFKHKTKHLDVIESQCPTCGNVNPDDILELIEKKTIDEYGQTQPARVFTPEDWYQFFRKQNSDQIPGIPEKKVLPQNKYNVPGVINQFFTYLRRSIAIKKLDRQFLFMALFITPILAIILSLFSKYFTELPSGRLLYIFSENVNIPSFLYMSIVVPLFVGLSMSAEEIIRDRKILKREQFLNLSWKSYLNSKVVFLFILSAIQTLLYVIISNTILEIKGMMPVYWVILFSIACVSNLTGLLLSAKLKSVVAIYIVIPLILIPQFLFSGVIIPFNKTHYLISSQKYVPLIADLMPARWAYEALMVTQYSENEYQKRLIDIDKRISNISYYSNYAIPLLNQLILEEQKKIGQNSPITREQRNVLIIKNELIKIKDIFRTNLGEYISELDKPIIEVADINNIARILIQLKQKMNKSLGELMQTKDSIINGLPNARQLKESYSNQRVSEVVLNSRETVRIRRGKNELIRLYEPIYFSSTSKIGRSHFYALEKKVTNTNLSTFWYNMIVIWFMTFILYLILLYSHPRKIKIKRTA